MNINRNNYEEFFLLYIDNELDASDKKAVELFVQENPDLAGELELFRQTSIVSDASIVFEGKDLLFKSASSSTISIDNYEEWLVAYLDNELNSGERTEFEQFAATHPVVARELAIFQQTKLQPEKELVFVNKEVLYKREEKVRMITMQWWKIAVAAAVILAVGITTFTVVTSRTATPTNVAVETKNNPGKNSPARIDQPVKKEESAVPVVKENNETIALTKKTENEIKIAPVKKAVEEKIKLKAVNSPAQNNNVIAKINTPVNNNVSTNTPLVTKNITVPVQEKKEATDLTNTVAVNTPVAKENNKTDVTNKLSEPSDNSKEMAYDATTNTDAIFASNNEEGKNKKLRGFFRKATRIFEKRTNISAADDDDKVLIGVLAVKLK